MPGDCGATVPMEGEHLDFLASVSNWRVLLLWSLMLPTRRGQRRITMARIRTFIALDLGESVRERLVSLQEALARTGAEVNWVEPENLHITLLFLGEVDEREVADVCRVVAERAQKIAPFSLQIQGAGAFPNLRRPRVIWVGVAGGTQEVVALHDTLEEGLLELGCYRREDRQFTPHVTLGRVKKEENTQPLAALLAKKGVFQAGSTTITSVQVMSSQLTPDGPIYSVLSRARLAQ